MFIHNCELRFRLLGSMHGIDVVESSCRMTCIHACHASYLHLQRFIAIAYANWYYVRVVYCCVDRSISVQQKEAPWLHTSPSLDCNSFEFVRRRATQVFDFVARPRE